MRQPGDILSLPYNLKEVLIKPNDFAIAQNLNTAIERFQANLEYLQAATNWDGYIVAEPITVILLPSLEVKEEFVDAFTINKVLSKLLYNNLTFNNYLHSRFVVQNGNLIGTRYIVSTETVIFNVTDANFVGINEIVSTAVINRALAAIYNIQAMCLSLLQEVPE